MVSQTEVPSAATHSIQDGYVAELCNKPIARVEGHYSLAFGRTGNHPSMCDFCPRNSSLIASRSLLWPMLTLHLSRLQSSKVLGRSRVHRAKNIMSDSIFIYAGKVVVGSSFFHPWTVAPVFVWPSSYSSFGTCPCMYTRLDKRGRLR